MSFKIPSLTETLGFLRALGRALIPGRDWTPSGTMGKWAHWFSGATTDMHAHLATVLDDLLPDKAGETTTLPRWASIRNVRRKPATGARKAKALRVTGTAGGAVAIGDQLTSDAGFIFEIASNDSFIFDGTKDVDLVAISTGSQTRLPIGEVLRFVDTPAGLEEEAQIVIALDEDGVDLESVGAWRTRVLDKFGDPPQGGARADYEQWATAQTGIENAYVYPFRAGLGTVDVAALHGGRGADRLLLAGEITDLQAALDELVPCDVELGVRVLTVAATDTDIEVTIVPDGQASNEFDWDDFTPPLGHGATPWDPATKKLQFTIDRPASMKPGDKITHRPIGGGGDGVEHLIESLSGSDAVILADAPDPAPVAGDQFYSGGPLVAPARAALLAHMDSLGTSNPDAHPYGTWEADLRPQKLGGIVDALVGVRKSTPILPVATVEPADNPYPDDGTVYMIAPRLVLARRAW